MTTRNLDIPLNEADGERFSILWEATRQKAFRYAMRLTGNKAEAEDLTADAFLRACRKFKDYQADRPFENWIFKILDRLNIDLRRKQSRRVGAVSYDAPLSFGTEKVMIEIPSQDPTPEDEIVNCVHSEDLETAMSALNPSYRRLLEDVFVHQISIKELADMGHICEGTLRSRLHRAIKQVRANAALHGARSIKV